MAVLFDLDGTIIGAKKSKSKIMNECAKELDLPPISREKYHEAFEEVLQDSKIETRVPVFEKIIGNRETAEKIAEMYRKRSLNNSIVYPDAEKVLKKLDVKKGLITNGPRQVQQEKIKKFDLERYFDTIVVSGEIGKSKPGKEIFQIALDNLQSKNSNSIYVGDVPKHDVAGARKAGIVSVLIKRYGDPQGPKADYEIENLKELYEILENVKRDNQ